MSTEATTTPDDVRRYVDTDIDDTTVQEYIGDAEDEALSYNDSDDFEEGEFDRLVRYYAALLISSRQSSGGDLKRIRQGARRATLTTDSDERDQTGWLRGRVRANDPSGQMLGGRASRRNVHFTNEPNDPYDAGYPERDDGGR